MNISENLSSILLDLYDIRSALPPEILSMLKDSEGTEFTIKDLLDDAIDCLESIN